MSKQTELPPSVVGSLVSAVSWEKATGSSATSGCIAARRARRLSGATSDPSIAGSVGRVTRPGRRARRRTLDARPAVRPAHR